MDQQQRLLDDDTRKEPGGRTGTAGFTPPPLRRNKGLRAMDLSGTDIQRGSIEVHYGGRRVSPRTSLSHDEVYIRPGWSTKTTVPEDTLFVIHCYVTEDNAEPGTCEKQVQHPHVFAPQVCTNRLFKVTRTLRSFRQLQDDLSSAFAHPSAIPRLFKEVPASRLKSALSLKKSSITPHHLREFLNSLLVMSPPLSGDAERLFVEFMCGGSGPHTRQMMSAPRARKSLSSSALLSRPTAAGAASWPFRRSDGEARSQDDVLKCLREEISAESPAGISAAAAAARVITRSKLASYVGVKSLISLLSQSRWILPVQDEPISDDLLRRSLIFVLEGHVEVRPVQDSEQIRGTLMMDGDLDGELNLLSDTPLCQNVYIPRSPAWVILLPQSVFQGWCKSNPREAVAFMRQTAFQKWSVAQYTLHSVFNLPQPAPQVPKISNTPELVRALGTRGITPAILKPDDVVDLTVSESQVDRFAKSSRRMAIVVKGTVRADNSDATYGVGAVIGGLETAAGAAGNIRVTAVSNAGILLLSVGDVNDHLCERNGPLAISLFMAIFKASQPTFRLFGELGLSHMSIRPQPGAVMELFQDKEPGDAAYILVHGRLRVCVSSGKGDDVTVCMIGRGGCFGEEGLQGHDRKYTVECRRDCDVVRVTHESYRRMCKARPEVSFVFSQSTCQRDSMVRATKENNQPKSESTAPSVVAVIPSRRISPEVAQGTTKGILAELPNAVVVSFDDVKKAVGVTNAHNDMFKSMISGYLSELEAAYDQVILDGSGDPQWSHFCIVTCDLVLLLTTPSSVPGVSHSLEQYLVDGESDDQRGLKTHARIELLMVHQTDSPLDYIPRGTSKFIDALQDQGIAIDMHHHVLLSRPADFGRLGRHVTGKSVGVVLSGGGARGIAHWGVLRAMEDHNIPVDYIGGTSQGSFIAALYSKYMSTLHPSFEAMVNFDCKEMLKYSNYLPDLTIPMLAMMTGKRGSRQIRAMIGDTMIEDLWIPFFCVTTNLSQSAAGVHRRGPLWRYVRASMSIFLVVPPMCDLNGDLLIDGGYCNNIPISIMKQLYPANKVLAVDVENKDSSAFEGTTFFDDDISGCGILLKRLLNPLKKEKLKLPSILQIQFTLGFMAHIQQLRRDLSRYGNDMMYLRVPVDNYGFMDYKKAHELCEIGYEHAYQRLFDWKFIKAGK